jgi:glucokinase
MAAGCVIGVDLGGTKLLAGTVDGDLRVHHRAYRRVPGMDGGAVLDTVLEAVAEARETAPDDVAAVGLGLPCLIDVAQGLSLTCNHLVLDGVPVRDMLSERLGLPVVVDQDAIAALLA